LGAKGGEGAETSLTAAPGKVLKAQKTGGKKKRLSNKKDPKKGE